MLYQKKKNATYIWWQGLHFWDRIFVNLEKIRSKLRNLFKCWKWIILNFAGCNLCNIMFVCHAIFSIYILTYFHIIWGIINADISIVTECIILLFSPLRTSFRPFSLSAIISPLPCTFEWGVWIYKNAYNIIFWII